MAGRGIGQETADGLDNHGAPLKAHGFPLLNHRRMAESVPSLLS